MNGETWNQHCILSPSLISCCDLCNLENSIRQLELANYDLLHIDILDGHFSPSMPLGLDTIRQLRKRTNMVFDVHLMATAHDFFVKELLDIGVDQIIFHAETEPNIDHLINQIHAGGARAGIALKPATSLSCLEYVLEKCDTVLLMLINPGYAQSKSEAQVTYVMQKLRALREMIALQDVAVKVMLDGRISRQNITEFGCSGLADIFVVGSTCLDPDNLKKSAIALKAYSSAELHKRE